MKIEKAAAEDIDETEWQSLLDKFIVWSDSCDYIRLGSKFTGHFSCTVAAKRAFFMNP